MQGQQIPENHSKGGKNNWLRAFRKVKNTKCRWYYTSLLTLDKPSHNIFFHLCNIINLFSQTKMFSVRVVAMRFPTMRQNISKTKKEKITVFLTSLLWSEEISISRALSAEHFTWSRNQFDQSKGKSNVMYFLCLYHWWKHNMLLHNNTIHLQYDIWTVISVWPYCHSSDHSILWRRKLHEPLQVEYYHCHENVL